MKIPSVDLAGYRGGNRADRARQGARGLLRPVRSAKGWEDERI